MFTGTTLNISMIGFIMLMARDQTRFVVVSPTADGREPARRDAASWSVRLRPILMTTAAMIGGMLPLALGIGEVVQAPMGRAIIGGAITSTLLTLFVVPILYTYLDGWSERVCARRAAKQAAAESAAVAPGGAAE